MRQHFIKQLMPEKSRRTGGSSEREGPHTKWEESRWCCWGYGCHFEEAFELSGDDLEFEEIW